MLKSHKKKSLDTWWSWVGHMPYFAQVIVSCVQKFGQVSKEAERIRHTVMLISYTKCVQLFRYFCHWTFYKHFSFQDNNRCLPEYLAQDIFYGQMVCKKQKLQAIIWTRKTIVEVWSQNNRRQSETSANISKKGLNNACSK